MRFLQRVSRLHLSVRGMNPDIRWFVPPGWEEPEPTGGTWEHVRITREQLDVVGLIWSGASDSQCFAS